MDDLRDLRGDLDLVRSGERTSGVLDIMQGLTVELAGLVAVSSTAVPRGGEGMSLLVVQECPPSPE